MQLFLSSRILEKFGVVRSLKILPLGIFVSSIGLLGNFSFLTAVLGKGMFEVFSVVHTNAYHNSYYAIAEHVREQVREFLEGIVRPLGTILGTALLLLFEFLVPEEYSNIFIHGTMALLGIIMLTTLFSMKEKYTLLSQKNLDITGDHPEKMNAIEILSQNGHTEPAAILCRNLQYKKESSRIKIKILKSLGTLQDPSSLPEILKCIDDSDEKVRIQAYTTLRHIHFSKYKDSSSAFTTYRILTTLMEAFKKETKRTVKSAIIRVFTYMHHHDIVPFLLERLEQENDAVKADIIYLIGQFLDINSGYYLEKFLRSTNPTIKANTIIALWQFRQYRLTLIPHLTAMIESKIHTMLLSGIFVLGETKSIQEIPRLREYLKSHNKEIRKSAALALAKMDRTDGVPHLIETYMKSTVKTAPLLKEELRGVSIYFTKIFHSQLEQSIQQHFALLFGDLRHIILEDLPIEMLTELRHWFDLLEYELEVLKIDHVLQSLYTRRQLEVA